MNTKPIEQPAVASALDRIGARRILQRIGVVHEPASGLPSDTPEVRQLLTDDAFDEALERLARKLDRDVSGVKAEAAGYLREMSATHSARVDKVWDGFGRWLNRAHDVEVDEEQARRVRALSRKHSLLFLMSHRSYLDGFTLPVALAAHGIEAPFTMGGANLNFFPVGAIARRTGVVFIRRSTSDLPVYRLALRSYIGQLIRNRRNLCWSIEGGRTRTGKLRPPVYGILRYVVDALDASPGTDPLIIPVSIVYEQLHEVALMTTEARGGVKRPEDLRWLVNFARSQGDRLGRAYLDFGTPLAVRERLAELHADDPGGAHAVERIALETCHRINRATPVTVTAVVCLALLAADRSLTLDEVLGTVAPLARYIEGRGWPVAGGVNLTDRATIRRTLQELVSSGVLSSYGAGTETIWGVGAQQHLVAAFYRNTDSPRPGGSGDRRTVVGRGGRNRRRRGTSRRTGVAAAARPVEVRLLLPRTRRVHRGDARRAGRDRSHRRRCVRHVLRRRRPQVVNDGAAVYRPPGAAAVRGRLPCCGRSACRVGRR